MAESGAKLIAFDVDRIKEFVFAGHRPIDTAGASELVKLLDVDSTATTSLNGILKGDAQIIYARGGSGLLLAPDADRAKALCERIEAGFREWTQTGSCSAACVDASDIDADAAGFQFAIKRLGARLQRRKADKASEEPAEAWSMGHQPRCQACATYPATTLNIVGDDREWVCDSCYQKREVGRTVRDTQRTAPTQSPYPMALSMNEIAGENGYVACLYADVNKAGGLLQLCENRAQARALSNHLYHAMQAGLKVVSHNSIMRERYQSPIVGGDDLVLLFPAGNCAEVALQVWQKVENALRRVPQELQSKRSGDMGDRLANQAALSVGLLVADAHFPVSFLFETTDALLRNAKTEGYKTGHSTLDYLLLKGGSPLSEDMKTVRRTFQTREFQGHQHFPQPDGKLAQVRFLELTRKPYTRDEFAARVHLIGAIGKATPSPASVLRQLERFLEQDQAFEAYINIEYQIARMERTHREMIQNQFPIGLLYEIGANSQGDSVVRTGLPDLLELLEMTTL